MTRWGILLVACFAVAGCSGEKKEEVPPLRSSPAQDQQPPAGEAQQPAQQPATEPTQQQPDPQQRAEQPAAPAPKPPSAPSPPKPDPNRSTTGAKPETPPAASVPKVEVPKPEPSRPEPAPPRREEGKPAPAPSGQAAAAMKGVIVMTGAPLGGVRLEHKLHAERAGNTCTSCHHPSRPEKPLASPQQACSECHTKTPAPPMKTKYQAAFHNPTAQSGTCISCHKSENAKGKKAPLKCTECHKKENA